MSLEDGVSLPFPSRNCKLPLTKNPMLISPSSFRLWRTFWWRGTRGEGGGKFAKIASHTVENKRVLVVVATPQDARWDLV